MKKIMLITLVSIFFLSSISVVEAATYYVAKTGCSDSYPGTESQPWCTIGKAAST
jgi:hypothetical protein